MKSSRPLRLIRAAYNAVQSEDQIEVCQSRISVLHSIPRAGPATQPLECYATADDMSSVSEAVFGDLTPAAIQLAECAGPEGTKTSLPQSQRLAPAWVNRRCRLCRAGYSRFPNRRGSEPPRVAFQAALSTPIVAASVTIQTPIC